MLYTQFCKASTITVLFYYVLHHQEALERHQGHPGDVEQVLFEVTELAHVTCYIPNFSMRVR